MDENSTIRDLKKYLVKNLVDFNVPLDTQVVMFKKKTRRLAKNNKIGN